MMNYIYVNKIGLIGFFLALTINPVAQADESHISWPCKSGPSFDGNVSQTDAKGLPQTWNELEEKNIAWKVPVKGVGHASPVVGEGLIWMTSATKDGKQNFVLAYDEKTGELVHDILLFENPSPEPLGNNINTYASPTPFLEPGAVYVHFGTYGTAKIDTKTGKTIWERRDINVRHFRGPGSSPVIFGKYLILTFDGIDKQFVTALDKETGETIWLTKRTTDYGDLRDGKPFRDGDLRKAFGTPGIFNLNGKHQVVSVGSKAAFGYDLQTGKEIWTIRHSNYNAAARPVFFDNLAIINTGSRGANLLAVKIDETTKGDVTETHIVWSRKKGNSRLSYPVLHNGLIYFILDTGVMTCVDAKTGDEIYSKRLGGNYTASPVIADGKLYSFSEDGTDSIITTGKAFKVQEKNKREEGGRASPAVANGSIFVRSYSHLYKLSETK